jgi:hypothetical protein
VLALLCALAGGVIPASADAAAIALPTQTASRGAGRSALVVFAPAGEPELAGVPGLSVAIMSASQGRYSPDQLALDITQGARVANTAYDTPTPPPLSLSLTGAGGGAIAGWAAASRRAQAAPQLLRPGLLASQIPGGAGYAGLAEASAPAAHYAAILAAGASGHIAAASLGPAATLLARVAALRRRERLVVAELPPGGGGLADLRTLARTRAPGELLMAIQLAPRPGGHELLWSALAGLPGGGGGRELTSQSTGERGLVGAFDLAPTILAHLGVAIPADVRGKPITTDGRLDSPALRGLMARLRVISARRLKALGFLLCAWALLLIAAACVARAAARPGASAWALRAGAVGVLWAPVAALLPAALEPGAPVEYALIAALCMGLGALTDALLPWPRAPLAPALAAVVLLSADALAGTQLLMRSLLGPDPALGARFYGIGNELKSGLAVLVAAAVAAGLYPSARGRRAGAWMAGAGVLLALVEGSARIGAGVGGVILVSFGFAVATVLLLPGSLTRRRALTVLISPVAGLVALALIDLASANGAGHFTGSVLHARSAGDLRDIITRRYGAAWRELHNHAMPVATGLVLVCAAAAVRWRERLLSSVGGDPGWAAALAGGLAAGIVGSLVEDSGPVLLVVAFAALACVVGYLWGRPRKAVEHAGLSGRRAVSAGAVQHDLVL